MSQPDIEKRKRQAKMGKRRRKDVSSFEVDHVRSEADKCEALELSVGVFSGFLQWASEERRERVTMPGEMIRVGRHRGKIVTHAVLIDKKMRIGSAVVRLCGVGGVSTHPKLRHRGFALAVMKDAIEFMKEKGYAASMLFSGAHELYRKCGYEGAIWEYRAELATRVARKTGVKGKLRKARPTDIAAMSRLYNLCNANRTGSMLRSADDWRRSLKHGGWFVTEDKGKVVGFARTSKRWSRGGKLRVDDSAARTRRAARSLIGGLVRRAIREGFDTVDLMGPPDHTVIRETTMSGGKLNWERGTHQMMRIIDLEDLLKAGSRELERRLKESELADGSFKFTLRTDIGPVMLGCERGSISVSVPARARARGPVAKIPQKFLMQLMMGYRTVEEVAEEDGASIPEGMRRALDVLFPPQYAHVWHPDRF